MVVRQEESTPIGNQFHDTGVLRIFQKIEGMVDEFEVDTERLCNWIDMEISLLKSLKSSVKKIESDAVKKLQAAEAKDMINKV